MKYKGYTGVVEFDEEAGVLFGRVIGLRDLITFEGESVAEVTRAFHDSVDVYLELCAERGENPEKPYSGQFILRIDPNLHRAMSHAAEERGVSLNSLVEEELKAAFIRPTETAPPTREKRPRGARVRTVGGSGGSGRRRA
jgi:predicted HicB family RNase H-like nuclease